MTATVEVILGPPEPLVEEPERERELDALSRDSLMRRHSAALRLLRYTSSTEERLALLLAVVAPSDEMLATIDAIDAGERSVP